MADDYYPPDDEQQQPQQSQPPEGFVPYQAQESQPPEGFVPYKPGPPEGFVPFKPEPPAPVTSAPPTATPEERRDIYGDEPLGLPRTPGGLSPTAGATVTSTFPTQDIPAPSVNKQGVTLPTYILRALGEGVASLPQRATQAAGELQRAGDVYDPGPAMETALMGYGARALAGGLKFRPIPSPGKPGVTAGPRITPEGQYQLPLEGTHVPQQPEPAVPRVPRQEELPLEFPSKADDALKRQGQTPGSDAAAGTAQEPRSTADVPVTGAENAAVRAPKPGPENYGKKTPVAAGEATGVNVTPDGVDPTIASTFKAEVPVREQVFAPGEQIPEFPRAPTAAEAAQTPPTPSHPRLQEAVARSNGNRILRSPKLLDEFAQARGISPDEARRLLTADPRVSAQPSTPAPAAAGILDFRTANRLVNQPRELRIEAARRGTTPEVLKSEALQRLEQERGRSLEPAAVPEGTMELPPVEVRPGEQPAVPAAMTAAEQAAFERGRYDAQSGIVARNLQDTPGGRAYQEGVRVEQEKMWGTGEQSRLEQRHPVIEAEITGRNLLTDERGGGRLPTAKNIAEAARAVGKTVAEFIRDERGGGRLPRTPAEEKVLSRLAPEPGILDNVPRTRAEAASQWRKFYAGFKNEADAFEQLKHRSLTPVAPEVDPGVLARLIKGLGGRINQVLEDGTYSVRTRQVTGDPLRTVMDKIAVDPAGFDAYAMARTAVERDPHGVKTGIPLTEARQVIAQSGAKWGPILTELNGWKGRMLDAAVDILGSKAVAAMKAKYPGHIALHRMLDPASPTAGLLGGGMQARNPLHRLGKGSERLILNVRDSTIKDGIALLDMAERNRVGMAMEDLNNKLGPNSKFMREVNDVHPIHVTAAEVNKHLGVEGITEQVADGFKVFRKDAFHPAPDRIRVFRDGKSKVYEVDPELGKAFHALEHHSFGLLTKILSVPAKMLRAGSVLIPEFIIKNLFRDQLAAFTQAKGFVPGVDTAMGMKNLFPGKSSTAFQRWQIEGGANSSLVSLDQKLFHQDPRTVLQHVSNVVTTPYHMLQMMSEVAENATRLGVYERAIKGGAHPIEATYAAREGTLDFQRIGGWAIQKALNQIIPFYNVALEGTDRTFRAFRDRKIATTIKTAAGITIPSLYIWAATKDDERIQQLPRWRKDVAWNIPGRDNWQPISTQGRNEILDGMGLRLEGLDVSKLTHTFRKMPDGSWQYNNGIIWALPKPPGIGQLFGSIPERMLDAYVKHDPNAYKELGKTMWQAFAPSIVPQTLLPEIERWANKSFFLDRTLVSPSLQKLPTSQQYGPQTSEVAKTIAAGIRTIAGDKTSLGAPIMIDNYIRAWSGGMGKYITDMIDLGLRDKDAPVKPAWSAADVPVLKGLVARFPSADAQAIQQFYDAYDERKQAAAGIKNLQKKGLPEDPALLRENPIQGIHNALGAGFKTVRNIAENKNMSAEDKRTAMDLTYLFMIEKAKQGNAALEQSKRQREPPPGFIPYQPRAQ